jgi:hypothetical protein
MHAMDYIPDPSRILLVAMSFWQSKVLLTAAKLEIFTLLDENPLSAENLGNALQLNPRGTYDFFDTLVAMKFLERDGKGASALYRNSKESSLFLVKGKDRYVGGLLEMCNDRLYPYWNDLEEGLRTGLPQNEIKYNEKPFFEAVYADPKKLEQFISAMSGTSHANFSAFVEKFDLSPYTNLCDIGGASAQLSILAAKKYSHLQCISYDLTAVQQIAKENIKKAGMTERVKTFSGDFMKDTFPRSDVIIMSLILHDWNMESKKLLIKKAFNALPPNGAFIAIENIIDDDRRENIFGLLMSLNMLIELGDAFDFTAQEFEEWCREAGFLRFEKIHLSGPCSAVIAYKSLPI